MIVYDGIYRYTKKDLDREARELVRGFKHAYKKDYRHCVKLDRWELHVYDGKVTLVVIINTDSGQIQRNIAI